MQDLQGNVINDQGSYQGGGAMYSVDIVFCIDATGSMQPVIDTVKNNALKFYDDFSAKMREKNKTVEKLRIKVVAFRDYLADKERAMLVTDFFSLPEQKEALSKCIHSIRAAGGGDVPEDGLEALAYSIKSNWNTSTVKQRQVIVVWTDAPVHELGFGKASPYYPNNMAKDFMELSEWWGDPQLPSPFINQQAKRLVLFAPDTSGWRDISDNWDQVIHVPSVEGKGLEELDYDEIMQTVANTV